MTRIRIRTPSRLHFGLLGWGPHSPRQFGGVGLMVDDPGIVLTAEPAAEWSAEGPLARRVLEVAAHLDAAEIVARPLRVMIESAPEEHVGLGAGTQLSLALARAWLALARLPEPSIETLAALCGRGQRSGIGLHGFARGGLIVDGGRASAGGVPPLLFQRDFPNDWRVLVVLPRRSIGLHGIEEVAAFTQLPPVPEETTDRLCRLVLLGLLPALVEQNLAEFGAALTALQRDVGRCFAPAQGGTFARPELAAIVADLQAQGLHGVGQSSWGPALYGFSGGPAGLRETILGKVRERWHLGPEEAFWTSASRGCVMTPLPSPGGADHQLPAK